MESTTSQKLMDIAKAVCREKSVALKTCIRKEEIFQIN